MGFKYQCGVLEEDFLKLEKVDAILKLLRSGAVELQLYP